MEHGYVKARECFVCMNSDVVFEMMDSDIAWVILLHGDA